MESRVEGEYAIKDSAISVYISRSEYWIDKVTLLRAGQAETSVDRISKSHSLLQHDKGFEHHCSSSYTYHQSQLIIALQVVDI